MINRRTVSTMLMAGAATSFFGGASKAQAQPAVGACNVVLVHGAYADLSCWSEVIGRLQRAGLTATPVQNPLTSLADDAAATRRILALQDGPTVLVGHSWAGTVISETGVDPKVSALVYVAARAPDADEDYMVLAGKFPTPPANAGLVESGGFAQLSEEAFLKDFAGGVDLDKARVLYAGSGADCRYAVRLANDRGGVETQAVLVCGIEAGQNHLSRVGAFPGKSHAGEDDRVNAGHLSLITHPQEITDLILDAAGRSG
jgi:pimeloyl-ACP methyl ester carboxylesterase